MVKLYKLKFTVLQLELLRYLFQRAGERFTARKLAWALEVTPPAIAKALPVLKKENLLTVRKDAGRLSIELQRDNALVLSLKRAENLKLLYESGLAQFLHEALPGGTVIVFGSYAWGEDSVSSDIDIAVIGVDEKRLDVSTYQKALARTIIINYYPTFNIDKHLRNNILNGIVLKGSIEL